MKFNDNLPFHRGSGFSIGYHMDDIMKESIRGFERTYHLHHHT